MADTPPQEPTVEEAAAAAPNAAKPSDEDRPPRRTRTPRGPRGGASSPDDASSGESSRARRAAPRQDQRNRIRSGLIEMYAGIGGGVSMFGMLKGDPGLLGMAQAMVANAEAAADAWLQLADNNPAVMRALSTMVEGSTFAAVLIAHAPMVMPLLQSRGVFGPEVQAAQAQSVAATFMGGNQNGAEAA